MAAWASQDTAPWLLPHLKERQSVDHKVDKACVTHPISPSHPVSGFPTLSCTPAAVTLISQLFIEMPSMFPPQGLCTCQPTAQKAFPWQTLLPHFLISIQMSPSSLRPPLAKNDGNYQQPLQPHSLFRLFASPGAWGHLTVHVFLFACLVLSDCARCSLQHTASPAVAHWLSGPTVCIWDLNSSN